MKIRKAFPNGGHGNSLQLHAPMKNTGKARQNNVIYSWDLCMVLPKQVVVLNAEQQQFQIVSEAFVRFVAMKLT